MNLKQKFAVLIPVLNLAIDAVRMLSYSTIASVYKCVTQGNVIVLPRYHARKWLPRQNIYIYIYIYIYTKINYIYIYNIYIYMYILAFVYFLVATYVYNSS